jgi:hypothetical protein
VTGRFDALDVQTGDGRVEADVRPGSTLVSDWTLRTGDGRLSVRMPADLSAELDVHSGDGGIEVDVPVTITGRASERHVRGRLNAGGKLLSISTGDGSVRLEKQ